MRHHSIAGHPLGFDRIILGAWTQTSPIFGLDDVGLENQATGYAGGRMSIIDAQVHIWAADTPERSWPEYGRGYVHRSAPFGKDEL